MYKLLIADDEYEIRHGLSSYFPWHEVGFQVVDSVENGAEVLRYISDHAVDVLLCDIMMPDCSGIEVAERLRRQAANVQVIFLSAHRNFEFARKALQLGVRNYILKPTKYQEIVDVFSETKALLDSQSNTARKSVPSASSETAAGTASLPGDSVVRKIMSYVDREYKHATLEGASQIVHMSPTYVSKYFKKCTGTNFSEYVNETRMNKALEILKQQQYKIYEISEMVSYQNAQNFARSFKRHFGKPPCSFIHERD
jgi:YesN/AraC family two-component response regulator